MSVRNIIKEYTLVTTIIEPITFSGPYTTPITVNVTFVKIGRSVTVTIPSVTAQITTSTIISSSPIPEIMYSDTQMILPYIVANTSGHGIASMTVYNNYFEFYYTTTGHSAFPVTGYSLGFNGFTVTYTSQN